MGKPLILTRERPNRHLKLAVIGRGFGAAVLMLIAGCASNPEPVPVAQSARRGLDCSPLTATQSLGPDATGIRVRNDSDHELLLFLDLCTGHRRLGTVRPNRSRLFGLPASVVLYGSDLVVHSFTVEPRAYYSTDRHTPGPDTMRLADTAILPTTMEVGGSLFEIQQHTDGPRLLIEEAQRQATLRLRCVAGQAVVEIGGLRTEQGPFDGVLVEGIDERTPLGQWMAVEDGWLRGDPAFVRRIVAQLQTQSAVRVQLRAYGFYRSLVFHAPGSDEATTLIPCLGPRDAF